MNRAHAWMAALVLFAIALSSNGARGDTPGKHVQGAFLMGPFGNATDFRDEYFTSLGLSLHPGDVLRYNWTANGGSGPPLYFEIHTHVPHYTLFRNASSASEQGVWQVPSTDPYMVFWRNLNNVSENVTYAYDLTPASGSPILLPLAIGVVAIGVAAVAVVVIRRRRRKPTPETPP